jgi:hypothetical protein
MRFPDSEHALVLRTDFSDDAAWDAIRGAISNPVGEFRAYVRFISDREFDGASLQQLVAAGAGDARHSFVFVVDRVTFTHPESPILVVDLAHDPGRNFRVIPSSMWSIENNLSLGNMDFEEFAESVGPDGIFRGFDDQ